MKKILYTIHRTPSLSLAITLPRHRILKLVFIHFKTFLNILLTSTQQFKFVTTIFYFKENKFLVYIFHKILYKIKISILSG